MDRFNPLKLTNEKWALRKPDVINYNLQHSASYAPPLPSYDATKTLPPLPAWDANSEVKENVDDLVSRQIKMLSLPPSSTISGNKANPISSNAGHMSSVASKYDPFLEDDTEDMDISDDEKSPQNSSRKAITTQLLQKPKNEISFQAKRNIKVKSGTAFYKGLILYIPPFEQLSNTYRGSPAMKMLYASFEFSLKMPIRIETKPRGNNPNTMDATVMFRDHIISRGSGWAPHVEASVRALEILSETCYTIQAKEDYFVKCKLVDAENMKTLNLKKWELLSEKYPKLVEITKESHIQKRFAVFLDSHTSTGMYEDIVCCNLTRIDVNSIKSVVEFFQLTMLPCSITTNLTKKHTPCVVSIHKYTSAQKLLDILVECGGENDKFKLYPPDTFKDFYKLHQHYWDPNVKKTEKEHFKTSLDDEDLQALVMKPYENVISELFEKHKLLPKVEKLNEDSLLRKAGDDFMKETLKIDMSNSKNVAPVQRMQLILKYMEQLQEYGSRVVASGRPEMIKIYHNAIDNLRKDLDECRKDIEKEQNEKSLPIVKKPETNCNSVSEFPLQRKRSPIKRRTPPRSIRDKSPSKRSHRKTSGIRSVSPKKKKSTSLSPKRHDRPRRSLSPRQRRSRSKSPRRRPGQSRNSPPRKRSPFRRVTPPRQTRSPRPLRSEKSSTSRESQVFLSIFKDQFRRFVEIMRRFRIEIENTPVERRVSLNDKLVKCKEQLDKFYIEAMQNPLELGTYFDEIDICKEELVVQTHLISGKPGPNDAQRISPPLWMNVHSFESPSLHPSCPGPRQEQYGIPHLPGYGRPPVPPPPGKLFGGPTNFRFPY